jgi:hypothetical protein
MTITCQQCMQDHEPDRISQVHLWERGAKVPQLFGVNTGTEPGVEIAPAYGCPLCVPPALILRAFRNNVDSARPWGYAQVQWMSGRLSEKVTRAEYDRARP